MWHHGRAVVGRPERHELNGVVMTSRMSAQFEWLLKTSGMPSPDAVSQLMRRWGGNMPIGAQGGTTPASRADQKHTFDVLAKAKRRTDIKGSRFRALDCVSPKDMPCGHVIVIDGLGAHMAPDLNNHQRAQAKMGLIAVHTSTRITSADAMDAIRSFAETFKVDVTAPSVSQRKHGHPVLVCSDDAAICTSKATSAFSASVGIGQRFSDAHHARGWFTEVAERTNDIVQVGTRVNLCVPKAAAEALGLDCKQVWGFAMHCMVRQWYACLHPHKRFRRADGTWGMPVERLLGRDITPQECRMVTPGFFGARAELTAPVKAVAAHEQFAPRAKIGISLGADDSHRAVFADEDTKRTFHSSDCVIKWLPHDDANVVWTPRQSELELDRVDWLVHRLARECANPSMDPFVDLRGGLAFPTFSGGELMLPLERAIAATERAEPAVAFHSVEERIHGAGVQVHDAGGDRVDETTITATEPRALMASDTDDAVAALIKEVAFEHDEARTAAAVPDFSEECIAISEGVGKRHALMSMVDGTCKIIDLAKFDQLLPKRGRQSHACEHG